MSSFSKSQRGRQAGAKNAKKSGASKGGRRTRAPRSGPFIRSSQVRPMPGINPNAGSLMTSTNVPMARRFQPFEGDEYIGEVAGSVGFATTGYSVNPGQAGTFPWGYRIASLFEEYEFDMLEFYFTAAVSGFATQGSTGTIVLSADYDSTDLPPASKMNVEDTIPHTRPCLPSTPVVLLKLDCARMKRGDAKFVRPGLQPANTDLKTYDCANVYVSTSGQTNTTNIGELHVRYKGRLFEPVLEAGLGMNGTAGAQLLVSSAIAGETAAATTVYQSAFVSTTTPIVLANGIGASLATTGLFTLNAGTYLIEAWNTGSDTAAALTAGTMEFNQVVTANTDAVSTSGAGVLLADDVSGHNDWNTSMSMIWPTANFGTTFCVQTALTYASGTALNHVTLRITQL